MKFTIRIFSFYVIEIVSQFKHFELMFSKAFIEKNLDKGILLKVIGILTKTHYKHFKISVKELYYYSYYIQQISVSG